MAHFPSLTLTYFDIPGRAEAIRKTLIMGGVPFVDSRVNGEQFAHLKSTLPYGKVPVLDVDGERISETQGILRYAGRLAGMYPSVDDPVACLLADEVLDTCEDLFERILMESFFENDAAKVKLMREKLLAGPLPRQLSLIDRRLAQIADYPCFHDETKIYVHDVLIADYVAMFRSGKLDYMPTTLIDDYKTMVQIHDKVVASPSVDQPRQITSGGPSLAPPPKLKLTYFDYAFGRAGHIRLALTIGGIAFEDDRVSRVQFEQRKAAFPYEQVPVVEIDNTVVAAQTFALLRYAGTIAGLYPAHDPLVATRIDEVIGHIDELELELDPSFRENDAEKKRVLRVQLSVSTIPAFLASLDKRIAYWKSRAVDTASSSSPPFAIGGATLTIADLMIYNLVHHLKSGYMSDVPETIADPFVHVVASYEAVGTHPRVIDWLATDALSPA